MKDVIIIGSGAVAAEVCSYIEDINSTKSTLKVKGFVDDSFENFQLNSKRYLYDRPYLGTTDTYSFINSEYYIFGFANIQARLAFLKKVDGLNLKFLTVIHPTAIIAKTAKIGAGNLINPYCVIGPNAIIGDNNIFTSYSFVSHDCNVGNNNFFSTAGLSGEVNVGNNNFLGIRVTVLPTINIGDYNTIQAGMTIDKDVSSHETVYYRYKEKVNVIKI